MSSLYVKSYSDAKKGDLVRIKKPEGQAGKIARISGSYFKYPSQNFYVFPGVLEEDGTNVLISSFEYLNDEARMKHEAQHGFVVKPFETGQQYNYQKALTLARCPTCHGFLKWQISAEKDDDRFCFALCCGMRYSMVPEVVRIVSATEKNQYEVAKEMTDDEFLKDLMNHTMNDLTKKSPFEKERNW